MSWARQSCNWRVARVVPTILSHWYPMCGRERSGSPLCFVNRLQVHSNIVAMFAQSVRQSVSSSSARAIRGCLVQFHVSNLRGHNFEVAAPTSCN